MKKLINLLFIILSFDAFSQMIVESPGTVTALTSMNEKNEATLYQRYLETTKKWSEDLKFYGEQIDNVKATVNGISNINRELNKQYSKYKGIYNSMRKADWSDALYVSEMLLGTSLNPNEFIPDIGGELFDDLDISVPDVTIEYDSRTEAALFYDFLEDVKYSVDKYAKKKRKEGKQYKDHIKKKYGIELDDKHDQCKTKYNNELGTIMSYSLEYAKNVYLENEQLKIDLEFAKDTTNNIEQYKRIMLIKSIKARSLEIADENKSFNYKNKVLIKTLEYNYEKCIKDVTEEALNEKVDVATDYFSQMEECDFLKF